MTALNITLNLTADQLAGLDHETARHNTEGEAAATEEAPWTTKTNADYVQFVMVGACQSYFNNVPK